MIRVRAAEDHSFALDTISIYVIDSPDPVPPHGGSKSVLRLAADGSHSWERTEPGALLEPTLRLPAEVARPLLDALHALFGAPTDARALRGDYDAERARVDKLIDALIAPPPVTYESRTS